MDYLAINETVMWAMTYTRRTFQCLRKCPVHTDVPDEQPGRWKSTAWTEETLYQVNQLPDTYRQAIIDGMETLRLEFSIDPDTLKTRLEIKTKRELIDFLPNL